MNRWKCLSFALILLAYLALFWGFPIAASETVGGVIRISLILHLVLGGSIVLGSLLAYAMMRGWDL